MPHGFLVPLGPLMWPCCIIPPWPIILLVAYWLVALRWGRFWMQAARWAPFLAFLALGIAYTAFSEHYNVHLVQRWTYSRWMPTIAGIGLVPLLQWVVVPTLCVQLVRSDGSRARG